MYVDGVLGISKAISSARPNPTPNPKLDPLATKWERNGSQIIFPFRCSAANPAPNIVDPEQSYYRDIEYRASPYSHNLSTTQQQPNWDSETQCMDSTQMWFCRDLWTDAAKGGLKEGRRSGHQKYARGNKRDLTKFTKRDFVDRELELQVAERQVEVERSEEGSGGLEKRQGPGQPPARQDEDKGDEDVGTDVDAIDEDTSDPAPAPLKPQDLPASAFLIPNSAFTAARILVNPRCVTTYGGVSHTQLALDLFGSTHDDAERGEGNYVLEDWAGPPDSFVCQEMRTTGGRTAPKSQRRVGFLLQNEVSGFRPAMNTDEV